MSEFTKESQLKSIYEICLDKSLGMIDAENAMVAVGNVLMHKELYYSKRLANAIRKAEKRKEHDAYKKDML